MTFTAIDAAGNRLERDRAGEDRPAKQGAPTAPTSLDRTPPGNVTGLSVNVSGRSALLRWRLPADADFDHLEIDRTKAGAKTGAAVYKGTGTTFTDHRLTTGVQYRYLIVTYDHTGNHSAGVGRPSEGQRATAVRAGSRREGRRTGDPSLATDTKGDLLQRAALPQRQEGLQLVPDPHEARAPESMEARRSHDSLQRGRYDWYVWPAFGTRAKPRFAPLEGFNSFVVTKV